jgi:hypothetical protein
MFCAPRLIFGGTEGVVFRFHVSRARTHFRRYKGHRVLFSCFARPNSFSVVLRASAFNVFRAQTHFRRYQGRRVPFSSFAQPDSFSAIPRASAPVFMFCAPRHILAVPTSSDPVYMFCGPGLVFGGTEGVWSCFHVLRCRTRFRWYLGCRLPFSCFALPH